MSDAPFVTADGASWSPLASGSLRERAHDAVRALASRVASTLEGERSDPSLSGGSAGQSVYFAQLAAADQFEEGGALAVRYLDEAIDLVSTARLGPSLYTGFAGVAWAAELVGALLGADGEDRNEAIDDVLLGFLARSSWQERPYDLIHGLTGLGVYALERWPRRAAAQCVPLVVAQLARRARHDELGTYWWTGPSLLLGPRRQEHPAGGVDLGVAHGVAGVIPFLARASALGVTEFAEPLLDGAVRWLLAHAIESDGGPTMPYFLGNGVDARPARCAWCYGDPGVAAALLVAAREARRPAWAEAAIELAVRAAERPPDLCGVTDACFCHGSAGLAHLFNRMYQMTGETKLAGGALFWLERTLELCEVAEGGPRLAGAQEGPRVPWNGLGLLEGAAGVGLVLLAASTTAEPAWDRMFLVSPLAATNSGDDDRK